MIDDAAESFELPRQIVVRRHAITAGASAAQETTSTGAIIRQIDSTVDRLSREAARLPADSALAADLHELQIRLVVLRQQVLGGEPAPRVRQAFSEVETARRLLASVAGQSSGAGRRRMTPSIVTSKRPSPRFVASFSSRARTIGTGTGFLPGRR